MKNKKIGWIGTGFMGAPMVGHLLAAGYSVSVFNRTKEKAANLLSRGATWSETPEALARETEVIVTIIGTPRDVEECYFGRNGIFAGLQAGTILVDMTTTRPSLAVSIAEAAQQRGAAFVDAPVSGGEVGAIAGKLSIMIGGDRTTVDELMPLFETFGKNMVYQGAAGSGQHAKMCNQITLANSLVGVCEALIYGYKAGLNLEKMLESISKGAAACWSLDVLAPKILKRDFSPGFSIDNFVKDLRIALEEADAMQLCLPGLALVKQLYVSVQANGGGSLGNQGLYLALEGLSALEQPHP